MEKPTPIPAPAKKPKRSPGTRGPRATPLTQESILEAAQSVFASQGFASTSIRAIAASARCDPKLIYYHFKDKDAIFMALLVHGLTPLLEEVRAIIQSPAQSPDSEAASLESPFPTAGHPALLWIQLQEIQRAFHRHLAGNAGLRQMIRGEMAKGSEAIRDAITGIMRPMIQTLTGLFQSGMRSQALRQDLNPILSTMFFLRMELEILDLLPAVSTRLLQMPPDRGVDLAEKEWLLTFWRGIAADKDAK